MQLTLFDRGEALCVDGERPLSRIELQHDAWLDVARGWLRGHEQLFWHLQRSVAWRQERRKMYQHDVEIPRQYALASPRAPSLHPVLEVMRTTLDRRYATSFARLSFALYRDGRDSVAWHGDAIARRLDTALVATISVGAPRKFLLRPYGGGRSMALELGWGDLVVMGGSCQRTYQHCIPKVARADPRIAIMFRPRWGEPEPVLR